MYYVKGGRCTTPNHAHPRTVYNLAELLAHLQIFEVPGTDWTALQRRHYFLHSAHVNYLHAERKTKWRVVTRACVTTQFLAAPRIVTGFQVFQKDSHCPGSRWRRETWKLAPERCRAWHCFSTWLPEPRLLRRCTPHYIFVGTKL